MYADAYAYDYGFAYGFAYAYMYAYMYACFPNVQIIHTRMQCRLSKKERSDRNWAAENPTLRPISAKSLAPRTDKENRKVANSLRS